MLEANLDTIRLFLHIMGATVWVGGQLGLAGLVGTVRSIDPEAPKLVARQFNKIAWAGYVVLLFTGIWNVLVVDMKNAETSYHITLGVKLLVVVLAGVSAAIHSTTKNRKLIGIFGGVGALASIAAVFFGVMLGAGS